MTLSRTEHGLYWAILCGSFLIAYVFDIRSFASTLDEGIYVNGGMRVAGGQAVYRDFFAFVGPVIYWVQGLLATLFGNDLVYARLSSALSVAAICAGLVGLMKGVAGLEAAGWAATAWFSLIATIPFRFEVNHRWMSNALCCLAGALIARSSKDSRSAYLAAGGLMGLAVFTTPSFVWPLLLFSLYLMVFERSGLGRFLVGFGCVSAFILIILAAQGGLIPFARNVHWAAVNYGPANRVPFGAYPIAVLPREWLLVYQGPVFGALALVLAILHWAIRRDLKVVFPAIYCIGVVLTAYPRWDAFALHYVAGPLLALSLVAASDLMPEMGKVAMRAAVAAISGFLLLNLWLSAGNATAIPTRAGTLYGSAQAALGMERLESAIPNRSTLFVYPYAPSLYLLLNAMNPSRYEFLQPGMMTMADEAAVMKDVETRMPDFVFWQPFSDEYVKLVWPGSDPGLHRFTRLESWVRNQYEPGVTLAVEGTTIRGQVWSRKQSAR